AGYVALSPDLYAKEGKRLEAFSDARMQALIDFRDSNAQAMFDAEKRKQALSNLPELQGQQISETLGLMFGGLDRADFVETVVAAASFLRDENAESKGRPVGSVGYCLGGALSAQLACHDPQLKAAVIYYGGAPADYELDNIQCPVVGFYGGLDRRITDSVPVFAETMLQKGKTFESHIYENAEHAFFNDGRPSYHLEASRDAFAKTLNFFNDVLKG
ncbi:MAG: Carboxymethylenebutenolidase, partial [Bacilli bacterium]|nr:Carboxymethylenebutenolidase [Bacilli bacterium]